MFKATLKIFLHEFRNIFNVEAILSILISGAVLYFFYYPVPYNNEEVRDAPVVVIDQDNSVMSKALMRKLNAADSINIVAQVATMSEAEHLMRNREIYGIFWIPFNFEEDVLSGRSGAISYYGDASYVIIYSKITAGVQSVVQALSQEVGAARQISMGVDPAIATGNSAPITPVIVPLYNPQNGYATYVIPPVYVLIVYQCLFLALVISLILGRRSDFDKALVADPKVSPLTVAYCVLIGKWLAYLLVSMTIFVAYMGLTPIFYQLPFHGSIPNLLFFSVIFLSGTIFVGIFIGQFFRKFDAVFLIIMPSSMLLFFLSGMSWPKEMIPDALYFFTYLLPIFPGITSMITLNQLDGSLVNIRPELIQLIVLMGGYSLLALAGLYYYYRKLQSELLGSQTTEGKTQAVETQDVKSEEVKSEAAKRKDLDAKAQS